MNDTKRPEVTETHRALARSIEIWIKQDGVHPDFIANQLAELTAAQPTLTSKDMGEVSDGYHTFNELYDHRCTLFLALMRAHPALSWISTKHHDGSEWDGWFIAGIKAPTGDVTYHLPAAMWSLACETGAAVLETGMLWDGHTAADVVKRVQAWIGFIAEKGDEKDQEIARLSARVDHWEACGFDGYNFYKIAEVDALRARAEAAESLVIAKDEALEFYAKARHFMPAEESDWESASGEPLTVLFNEAGDGIETGHFAKVALALTPASMVSKLAELEKERDAAIHERKCCHEIYDNIRRALGYPDGAGYPMLAGEVRKAVAQRDALIAAGEGYGSVIDLLCNGSQPDWLLRKIRDAVAAWFAAKQGAQPGDHHENCDALDRGPDGIVKPCNCKTNTPGDDAAMTGGGS